MARLRTSMDVGFHDFNVASPQTLEGCAKLIPGLPAPADGARASKYFRMHQLWYLGQGLPLGIVPSFVPPISPPPPNEFRSICLQSVFRGQPKEGWWVGVIGQVRPKIPYPTIKIELPDKKFWEEIKDMTIYDLELPQYKDVAKFCENVGKKVLEKTLDKSLYVNFIKSCLDKSIYAISLCSEYALNPSTSLLLNIEKDGQRKHQRTKAMLVHKLPQHDITLEAAWPELFVDHKGKYWDVPESISLDCSSLLSESGLRYRFGIHKNGGLPQSVDSVPRSSPASLMPGVCAKAAFSYEKGKELWRIREKMDDLFVEAEHLTWYARPAYDIRMGEPFKAISGIIGGTCEAWFGGWDKNSVGGNVKRSPFSADLFGSVCYTIQRGKFRKAFRDLRRYDARLDIPSAWSLAKGFVNIFRKSSAENLLASPRLTLILQKQVVGPIVFRLDTKFCLDERCLPCPEDVIFSFNFYLRFIRSTKLIAWYSPKRKEAMIEIRSFEF